jgi:hypothetical protein
MAEKLSVVKAMAMGAAFALLWVAAALGLSAVFLLPLAAFMRIGG